MPPEIAQLSAAVTVSETINSFKEWKQWSSNVFPVASEDFRKLLVMAKFVCDANAANYSMSLKQSLFLIHPALKGRLRSVAEHVEEHELHPKWEWSATVNTVKHIVETTVQRLSKKAKESSDHLRGKTGNKSWKVNWMPRVADMLATFRTQWDSTKVETLVELFPHEWSTLLPVSNGVCFADIYCDPTWSQAMRSLDSNCYLAVPYPFFYETIFADRPDFHLNEHRQRLCLFPEARYKNEHVFQLRLCFLHAACKQVCASKIILEIENLGDGKGMEKHIAKEFLLAQAKVQLLIVVFSLIEQNFGKVQSMNHIIKEYVIQKIDALPGVTSSNRGRRTKRQNFVAALDATDLQLFRRIGHPNFEKWLLDWTTLHRCMEEDGRNSVPGTCPNWGDIFGFNQMQQNWGDTVFADVNALHSGSDALLAIRPTVVTLHETVGIDDLSTYVNLRADRKQQLLENYFRWNEDHEEHSGRISTIMFEHYLFCGYGRLIARGPARQELTREVMVDRHDDRRIEVIAVGLPLHRGTQLAVDCTLVSPLNKPRRYRGTMTGAALTLARRRKYQTLKSPAPIAAACWSSGWNSAAGSTRRRSIHPRLGPCKGARAPSPFPPRPPPGLPGSPDGLPSSAVPRSERSPASWSSLPAHAEKKCDMPWLRKLSAEIQIAAAKIPDDASSIPWQTLAHRRNPNFTRMCSILSFEEATLLEHLRFMLVLICRSLFDGGHLRCANLRIDICLREACATCAIPMEIIPGLDMQDNFCRHLVPAAGVIAVLSGKIQSNYANCLLNSLASIQDDLHVKALDEECSSGPVSGLSARDFNQSNMFASQRDEEVWQLQHVPHGDVLSVHAALHHFLCHE
eukprot:s1703_g24.t1